MNYGASHFSAGSCVKSIFLHFSPFFPYFPVRWLPYGYCKFPIRGVWNDHMSKYDYIYKEISVEPFFLESCIPTPDIRRRDEEERKKQEREEYVQTKMREVRSAINRELTPRQKECLTLHYLRGYNQGRIAARLNIHQTTVSQHIRYALKKLRRYCNA